MARGSVAQARRRQTRRTAKRLEAEGAKRAPHPDPHALPADETSDDREFVTVSLQTRIDRALDENAWTTRQERNADLRELGLLVADAARIARKEGRQQLARIEEQLNLIASLPLALTEPYTGTCTCGHDAMQHQGEYHEGTCTVGGCDCASFDEESAVGSEGENDSETDAPIEQAAAIPANANYGPAVSSERCGNCEYFNGGTCRMWEADVEAGYVCNRWEAGKSGVSTESASQVTVELAEVIVTAPPEIVPPEGVVGYQWTAVLIPEGTMTDDGRCFAPGSIIWRELPLTLCAMLDSPHADVVTKAEACGRIDRIWRDGNLIRASGIFDNGEYGQKIAQMVDDKTLRGISVDVAVQSYEVGPKEDWFDVDGNWAPKQPDAATEEESAEGDLLELILGDGIYVVTEGTIGTVTVCPFPAFADARIEIAASLAAAASPAVWTRTAQHDMVLVESTVALTASVAEATEVVDSDGEQFTLAVATSSAPVTPRADRFTNPNLQALTPLTIEDDWVYGHAAAWDVCHIGFPDECVTAPHSATGNALFHLGQVVCDGGEQYAIGKITMGTGHADRHLDWQAAAAHYDNTGTVVADVISGEDEHGIWISGALRPNVDGERLREFRAGTLSGDWRKVNGNLELIACLVVNVPGFPIPRVPLAMVAAGEVVSLAAAGLHPSLLPQVKFPADALERLHALRAAAHGALVEGQG